MLSPLANGIAHADIASVNSGMEVGDNALQRPLSRTISTAISYLNAEEAFKDWSAHLEDGMNEDSYQDKLLG